MAGRNPGHITQQGQVLADLFEQAGYPVTSVSAHQNRYRRLIDIVRTLVRDRRQTDLMILEVYGGRSFVVEDIASWLGSRFGFRIVMWLHGGALPEFMTRFSRWTTRVLRRADLLVTPSQFLARAIKRYGFESRVIPNVIDLPKYPYRHRESVKPRLFWMRSFHKVWNPSMAVRVLDRLRVTLPDASLVMAGPDKGSQSEVEKLAATLGVADRVRFAGFLDGEGKMLEADRSDIFINTNRIDNMPVAIIEACAMGLPVISTRVGGIPDLLTEGQNGVLVPDNDDAAMAAAVLDVVKDSSLAARLSRSGRALAEQLSWERVRPHWETVFAQILDHVDEAASPAEQENQLSTHTSMMETP